MLTEDLITADPARVTVRSVGGLDQDIRRLWTETDPSRIVRVATAALAVDRFPPCRTPLWSVVDGARAGVAVTTTVRAVSLLAADDFLTGQWDECTRLADEGIALCARRGYRLLADPLRLVRAHVAAARGEHTAATALLGDVAARTGSRGVPVPGRTAHQVSALLALAGGDPERAFTHASAVAPAGTLPAHDHAALAVAADLVEAARRTGRTHDATCHARAMRAAPLAARSPRFAMLALGAHAVAVSPGPRPPTCSRQRWRPPTPSGGPSTTRGSRSRTAHTSAGTAGRVRPGGISRPRSRPSTGSPPTPGPCGAAANCGPSGRGWTRPAEGRTGARH